MGSGPSLATLLEGLDQSAGDTATQQITIESSKESSETATESTTPSTETESTDISATTPVTESQALPESGAILPGGSSGASLVLASLLLVSLVGDGDGSKKGIKQYKLAEKNHWRLSGYYRLVNRPTNYTFKNIEAVLETLV